MCCDIHSSSNIQHCVKFLSLTKYIIYNYLSIYLQTELLIPIPCGRRKPVMAFGVEIAEIVV